jgi:ubiquinone/menaquinone biosynthesis C-methylase UbiE
MPDFKRAVLIGNSEFISLPALRCPPADVEALSQILRDEEVCWFSPVHSLLNAPHNEILTRINEVLRDADKEDLVLIYYSGHGLLDGRGRLFLAARNTNPSLLHATAVSVSAIRDCLSQSRCQRFVLILDCCYSGAATATFRQDGQAISTDFPGDKVEGIGEFVMSASTAIQRAEQKQDDALSLFTKHLVKGLRESSADADGDGVIRLEELYNYVKRHLASEGNQEPLHWVSGSAASFIIGRTPRSRENLVQGVVREYLARPGTRGMLPPSIVATLDQMVEMDVSEFRTQHNSTSWLAYAWAREEIPTNDFIDQWYRLRSDLNGVDRPADVPMEKRWRIVNAARKAVLDLVGPTYLLDANFHFLDWNPTFDEILAKPLRLLRGTHAENLVIALENSREVIARAQQRFQDGAGMPLVDFEVLRIRTARHGLIQFRKIASQIAGTSEHGLVWSVSLNIEQVERADQLWEDIERRLAAEANWSRYAESYDEMLLHFREYEKLLVRVSDYLGNAQRCADLGAGTGNSTLRLLAGNPERLVSAFESNEVMLQHLRDKLSRDPEAASRVTIYKGDVTLSLREFPENAFDGALMVNVLYALDEPERCLAEVFRVLKPEGCLALSTSHSGTDVGGLFDAIRTDLSAQGLLDKLRNAVEDAEDRHKQMSRNILRDTREGVVQYLKQAGFEICNRIESAYAGAVMIVQARKPVPRAQTVAVPPPAPLRDQIFISYSHIDREWLQRLQVFLKPVFRTGRLKPWDDTNIRVGSEWRAEIRAAIDRARVAILLVSPDFLASDFIADAELPNILEAGRSGGLTIVWLLLSATPYQFTPVGRILGEIQCAHPEDTPLDTLHEPEQNQFFSKLVGDLVEFFPDNDAPAARTGDTATMAIPR